MEQIKIFAYLREEMGPTVSLALEEPVTKKSVLATLVEKYPKLKNEIEECEVAVNQAFLKDNDSYEKKDVREIALIPPVSGG